MWKQTSKRYPPKDHLRQSLLGLSLGLSLIALSSPVKAHATEELPSTAAEIAQQDQITFVILDAATREPIIGAVVRCVGATTPAMTDKNGRCTLRFKTAISSAQLDISCVGYQRVTRTVAVPAGKVITVKMSEDAKMISKVEVTARKHYTNQLQQTAKVDHKAIERGGAMSLAKLLETVPGVSSISSGSTIAKLKVNGNINMGYDTNARGVSGSGSLEMGYKRWGLRLHGMYTKGGDYRTAEYILNNTGYNTISMSAMTGYHSSRITATLFSSLYYQRSGIYYASKVSDLDQLIKRFEHGRPDESTFRPFSYKIQPPFQQSQHFTVKGEVKWNISDNHQIDFTASFQENLRQEFENRKKTTWSWIPMQDLILKTFKADVLWHAKWNRWGMTTDVGTSNTYQTNYNYPGTKQPAFVPNFAALSMGGYFLHKAALGMRYDFRVMSVSGYTSLSSYTYYDDFKLYSNFTTSLAGHYQIDKNWDVRANIGWSWRPPDINELYAIGLQDGSYWVEGNRHLASERGYKAVLGARYRNSWISVEPSTFYQRISSYIYDHIGTGKDRFHNHPSGKYPKFIYDQDDVQLYGGDIEATVRPMDGLSFVGKGEWMFARNITRKDWLPFMPSDRYGLSGTYDFDLSRDKKYHASLSLSSIYVTKQRRFDPDKDLVSDSPDPYFLLNGTAEVGVRLPHQRSLRVMLVGDNILNNLYKEYTDRFRYYAHARGANVSMRLLFKF